MFSLGLYVFWLYMLVINFLPLTQPGPHDFSQQCLIIRNKKNSTFYVHLALTPCKFTPVVYYFKFCISVDISSMSVSCFD